MSTLANNSLFVRNVDDVDWPGFGVGMIRHPERNGLTTAELEIVDDRIVFPAWRPRCDGPFRALQGEFGLANIPAMTLRTNAFVVNGPSPIRVGEIGVAYRGPMLRCLVSPFGFRAEVPQTVGPYQGGWELGPRGYGWQVFGRAPESAVIAERVHYVAPPSVPATGLEILTPTSGISAGDSADCRVRLWGGKYFADGSTTDYYQSGQVVTVWNTTSQTIGGSKIAQAKLSTTGDRYIVDVEECDA